MSERKANHHIWFSTGHVCRSADLLLGCHTPQGKKLSGWWGDHVTPSKTASCNTSSTLAEPQEQQDDSNI
eukprot:11358786-Ditylum_brightwellii.AAC.1